MLSVIWDGTYASGGAVASGVYLIRLETAGNVVTNRVGLVR